MRKIAVFPDPGAPKHNIMFGDWKNGILTNLLKTPFPTVPIVKYSGFFDKYFFGGHLYFAFFLSLESEVLLIFSGVLSIIFLYIYKAIPIIIPINKTKKKFTECQK